jgi:hypothetical protein
MQHFSEETWTDFVRGVSIPATRQAVEAHLAAGCAECSIAADFWSRIEAFTAKEGEYVPPENSVRLVKLGFACKQPEEEGGWTFARQIFDSMAQPLPIGVRSGAVSTRQVVYEVEGLTVDLRFERKACSNTISASGQVLDRQAPLGWLEDASLVLWTENGRMITTTKANDHGEFQFEFEAQDHLRISIVSVGRKTVRIPLGKLE